MYASRDKVLPHQENISEPITLNNSSQRQRFHATPIALRPCARRTEPGEKSAAFYLPVAEEGLTIGHNHHQRNITGDRIAPYPRSPWIALALRPTSDGGEPAPPPAQNLPRAR